MKIVLAYSGGLDTSVLLSWIKDTYGNTDMIAFCAQPHGTFRLLFTASSTRGCRHRKR